MAVFVSSSLAQMPAAPKPKDHVLGTITAVNLASQNISVKDDKSGIEYNVSLATTKTLLKVEPNAKNLSGATRIRSDDLAVGDRVDVRGFKASYNSTTMTAASVILMSARDLEQARRREAAEWQRALTGTVTAVDVAGRKLDVRIRGADGPTSVVVDIPAETRFTRYAPEMPKTPAPSCGGKSNRSRNRRAAKLCRDIPVVRVKPPRRRGPRAGTVRRAPLGSLADRRPLAPILDPLDGASVFANTQATDLEE